MTSEQMQPRTVIATWSAFPAPSPPHVRVSFVFFAYPRTRLVPRLSTFMTLHNSNSVVVKVRQRDRSSSRDGRESARIRDDRGTSGNREVFIYRDAEIRMTTCCESVPFIRTHYLCLVFIWCCRNDRNNREISILIASKFTQLCM